MKSSILKFRHIFSAILLAIIAASCLSDNEREFYSPVIRFEGYFNDEWLELPGHFGMPNTCTLNRDTVEIWCYNDTFKNTPANLRDGIMLWIQIHPFTVDTTCDFCTVHLRVRVSDYATGLSQQTYSIYPQDTLMGAQFAITGDIVSLERKRGGRIDIKEINIPLHLEGKSGIVARIKNARIYGNVQQH